MLEPISVKFRYPINYIRRSFHNSNTVSIAAERLPGNDVIEAQLLEAAEDNDCLIDAGQEMYGIIHSDEPVDYHTVIVRFIGALRSRGFIYRSIRDQMVGYFNGADEVLMDRGMAVWEPEQTPPTTSESSDEGDAGNRRRHRQVGIEENIQQQAARDRSRSPLRPQVRPDNPRIVGRAFDAFLERLSIKLDCYMHASLDNVTLYSTHLEKKLHLRNYIELAGYRQNDFITWFISPNVVEGGGSP